MNRASVSDINRKDRMNHSILDAGLIVYHTPHQLAVTTLPLPPCHRVRLTNTDSSRLELEVVVCTKVWNFRYIDRFLLDVHFTNRGGDTLDRSFKECFSHASIYLIGKPIICFVKIKIKPNCNISTNNNGLVDEVQCQKFRERQSEWFGKRGLSWHVSSVVLKQTEEPMVVNYTHVHV